MKCVIYLRMSLDKSNEGLGIERQRAECLKHCQAKGYDVIEVIEENNVSASFGKRDGFTALLSRIETGGVDVIVTYRLDRLLRKLTDLEALIELSERTGVTLDTVQGEIDISNAQGRLIGRILASVARSEAEVKGERHRLANAQRAARGLPQGSRRPFGYEADLVTIYEPEAAVLREMASRLLAGHGYNEIAKWANAAGYSTTEGKPFMGVTICNMLKKHRYGGIRSHKGVLYPGIWQPVFDPKTWERLQLEIRVREGRNIPKARKYILTGLAFCGVCGSRLHGSTKVDRPGRPKRRIYQCTGCRKVARNAIALDHYVREAVIDRLDTPELAELLAEGGDSAQLTALIDDRQAQQKRLDMLIDDYGAGLLSREQLQRAKTAAEARLAELDVEIDRITKQSVRLGVNAGESVRDAWERSSSDDWRRQLLGLVIKKITVNQGATKPFYVVDGVRMRFDPALIEIEWAN